MESEQLAYQIEQSYKNLQEKFNPTAKQLITASKAYVKSMQGSAIAYKAYIETLRKMAVQSKESATGATADIASYLNQVLDVYEELQSQQNGVVNLFYEDFIAPLQNGLEKDIRNIQTEHKKFATEQKARQEALFKAESQLLKRRKKRKPTSDGEIKHTQKLQEEKAKFYSFVDQSFLDATTEERSRYGFVLELLCSLGRHKLAFYGKGAGLLQKHVEEWDNVNFSKSFLPSRNTSRAEGEIIYSVPKSEDSERSSRGRARSTADSSEGGKVGSRGSSRSRRIGPHRSTRSSSPDTTNTLKSKSDLGDREWSTELSVPITTSSKILDKIRCARVSYQFRPKTEHQLTLEIGDIINLIGAMKKGWQYGENQRTRHVGWFPAAYVEPITEEWAALGPKVVESVKRRPQSAIESEGSGGTRLESLSLDRKNRRGDRDRKARSHHPRSSSDVKGSSNRLPEERPASSFASEKDTFKTFNSHLFTSGEEDTGSYHNSYLPSINGKYTSFSDNPDSSVGFTSPELPSSFRKPASSKDSIQYSEDSGFSNEEDRRRRQITSPYTEVCSKSVSSWVTDSSATYGYGPPRDEKPSPFLKYLYPGDDGSCSSLRHASSMDRMDNFIAESDKRKKWIVNAFGTFGSKKKKILYPCARRIASQKARRKNLSFENGKSSSLLCIDVSKCTSSPDEAYATNYEAVNYRPSWKGFPIGPFTQDLPSPPPFDPPSVPDPQSGGCHNAISSKNSNHKQDSSSGNSSWSENESSCLDAYMVVKDHSLQVHSPQNVRQSLSRSYTWTSQDFNILTNHNKTMVLPNYPILPPPKPKKKNSKEFKVEDDAPPLPPRRKVAESVGYQDNNDVDIFNYSEHMSRRMASNGSCKFDQRSFTTGKRCSIWYDLWGSDPYRDQVV